MSNEKTFKPCGEGENICNCKSKDECGYKAKNWPESPTPLSAEDNPNAKYIYLDAVLRKHWQKRNEKDPELLLSGTDEQMIFDCMIEYDSKKTASLQSQVEELTNDLKSLIDVTEKTRKEEKEYNQRLSDRAEELFKENESLKQRCEKMEKAIKSALEDFDWLQIMPTNTINELKQSLTNKA